MTPEAKARVAQFIDDLSALMAGEPVPVPTPTPTPVPVPPPVPAPAATGSPVQSAPKARIPTVYVKPGDSTAVLSVYLDRPANQPAMTHSFMFRLKDASTVSGFTGKAWTPGNYIDIPDHAVMFLPDETRIDYQVKLMGMQPGWRVAAWLENNEDDPGIAPVSGFIECVALGDARLPVEAPTYIPRPAKPTLPALSGLAKLYSTDFLDITQFTFPNEWNLWINKEQAVYAVPGYHPGAEECYQVRNGIMNLMLCKPQSPVLLWPDKAQAPDNPLFQFMTGMLTTRGRFSSVANTVRRFVYEEAYFPDGRQVAQRGLLPAHWRMIEGGNWSTDFGEQDDAENYPAEDRTTITDHYRKADGSHGLFSHNPFLGAMGIRGPLYDEVVITRPDRRQTWINGVLVDDRPNVQGKPMYEIFSMAYGGQAAGDPVGTWTYPVRWPIHSFEAWAL